MNQTQNRKAKGQAKAKNQSNNSTKTKKQGQKKKQQQRGTATGPAPLFLNAPQLGAGIQCGFRFRTGTTPTSLIVEGRDLSATAISASSATPATHVRTTLQISVDANSNVLCTRWGTWGLLFQKWRIRKLHATLVSNMASTTVGSNYLAMYVEANATPASTAEAIMRLEGSVMGNAYSQIRTRFDSPAQSLVWYECTADGGSPPDLLESLPGFIAVGTDGYSSALVPGKLVIDYELEFADPR